MASASLVPLPRAVFYDANGAPLSGGYVYTYVPGGTVTAMTWQDANEVTANSNPIVLDANGSALIYGTGNYQITVTDALGNQVPAYSGLSSVSLVSSALAPVLAAPTILAAANLLLASGLSIELGLTGGLSVTGGEVAGVYRSAACLLWVNQAGTATSATLPELGGQFQITSNLGLANHTTAEKIALTSSATGGSSSADIWAATSIATGFGGTYRVTGHEADVNNIGASAPVLGQPGSVYGYVATAGGTANSTAGVFVNFSTANWQYGVAVTSGLSAAFFEDSTATVGLSMAGTHTTAIDCSLCTLTNAIVIPNRAIIAGYDAGTPEVLRNIASISNSSQLLIGDPGLLYTFSGNSILPLTDNIYLLGNSTNRWSSVWAVTGTIQTSDPRLKTSIEALPDALPIVAAINPVTFKWRDGGNGKPGARTHWGFLAPDLKAGFEPTGRDFGGYVLAEDGSEHMRPDQLIPVLWKAVQELSAKVAALEKGLTK